MRLRRDPIIRDIILLKLAQFLNMKHISAQSSISHFPKIALLSPHQQSCLTSSAQILPIPTSRNAERHFLLPGHISTYTANPSPARAAKWDTLPSPHEV